MCFMISFGSLFIYSYCKCLLVCSVGGTCFVCFACCLYRVLSRWSMLLILLQAATTGGVYPNLFFSAYPTARGGAVFRSYLKCCKIFAKSVFVKKYRPQSATRRAVHVLAHVAGARTVTAPWCFTRLTNHNCGPIPRRSAYTSLQTARMFYLPSCYTSDLFYSFKGRNRNRMPSERKKGVKWMSL